MPWAGLSARSLLAAITPGLLRICCVSNSASARRSGDVVSQAASNAVSAAATLMRQTDGIPGESAMICVRTGGPHLDESAAARRCAELYASLKGEDQPAAPTVRGETAPLAEFVIKKIERGQWAVMDPLTGKPVDHVAVWKDSQR